MQTKTSLKIDWATHGAAKFACENWHYSGCVPKSKQNKIGVWEDEKFLGVIMVGSSTGPHIFSFLGLNQFTGAELTRVALKNHKVTVSRILSIALKFIKKKNPKLKAIVSFADANVGHHGGIYQAGNWKYFGRSTAMKQWKIDGKWRNDVNLFEAFKGKREMLQKLPQRTLEGKHKYVYFFDKELEKKFEKSFLIYPKRVTSIETDVSGVHPEEGGVSPTVTLHSTDELQHGSAS